MAKNYDHYVMRNSVLRNNKVDLMNDTCDDTMYLGPKKVDLSGHFSKNGSLNFYNSRMSDNSLYFDAEMLRQEEEMPCIDYELPFLPDPTKNGTISYNFTGEDVVDSPDVDYMDSLLRLTRDYKPHMHAPAVKPLIHYDASETIIENTGGGMFSINDVFGTFVEKIRNIGSFFVGLIQPVGAAHHHTSTNVKPHEHNRINGDIRMRDDYLINGGNSASLNLVNSMLPPAQNNKVYLGAAYSQDEVIGGRGASQNSLLERNYGHRGNSYTARHVEGAPANDIIVYTNIQ